MRAAEKLRFELERYHALRQHRDPAFCARLHELQAFQARRLQHTHAELVADPVFHDATELFLNDVYGGIDLMPMAREIERALPLAVRILPESVLGTSAIATEVMVLTQELDEQLCTLLHETLDVATLTTDAYVAAFHELGRREDRNRQMALARDLGYGLDKYVRSRLIFTTFRMVSGPAHRYGLGNLYDFMDRGFRIMRPMGSVHELFDRITAAEGEALDRLFAGDPDPYRLEGKMP
ncbi:MAG: FFLEELY motif protein [Gammaproteobacteria bacterium]